MQFGSVFDSHLVEMLQISCKFVSMRVAIPGLSFDSSVDHLLQLRRDRGLQHTGWLGIIEQAVVDYFHRRRAGERNLTREHFVEDHAHCEDVGTAIAALALYLLR